MCGRFGSVKAVFTESGRELIMALPTESGKTVTEAIALCAVAVDGQKRLAHRMPEFLCAKKGRVCSGVCVLLVVLLFHTMGQALQLYVSHVSMHVYSSIQTTTTSFHGGKLRTAPVIVMGS